VNTYAKSSDLQDCSEIIIIRPPDDNTLDWVNIVSISANLFINNGRADMSGSVIGRVGTQSITGNAVLERVNPNGTFTHIESWNNLNTNSNVWTWSREHNVARGHDYRLTISATVVRNGVREPVSISRTTRAN